MASDVAAVLLNIIVWAAGLFGLALFACIIWWVLIAPPSIDGPDPFHRWRERG